ncbi:hypothetical protein [Microbacterium sp. PF5]|uniref:hypothetical protein n=1 Tax=Microbacterium sp. PF5 TaxID=2305435 RepID=UPI00109B9809|nr:hypothetical protein [Microbacterium sp. PF5]
MAEMRVHVCNGITGARVETVRASAFSYARLLSAGAEGTATIPLDGSMSPAEIDALFAAWKHMLVLERNGVVEFIGYIVAEPQYTRGTSTLQLKLGDLWSLLAGRLAVDHSVGQAVLWSQTVTGNLATHANTALVWARDSYTGLPNASFPLTIPGVPGGTSVTRTYYGYHLQPLPAMLNNLMDEGLDIYFKPQWLAPGMAGWVTHANNAWSSGTTREMSVTAPFSQVTGFTQRKDAARVINNSIRAGEGSELDMLAVSNIDMASPLPLLERVTNSKDVTSASQLSVLAGQDLVTYGEATVQWDLEVLADTPVDVGDTLRLHFSGDLRIPDGWYTRRVVKIAGDMGNFKTVSVQATGGA